MRRFVVNSFYSTPDPVESIEPKSDEFHFLGSRGCLFSTKDGRELPEPMGKGNFNFIHPIDFNRHNCIIIIDLLVICDQKVVIMKS